MENITYCPICGSSNAISEVHAEDIGVVENTSFVQTVDTHIQCVIQIH